jgi:hypothetical protein
MITKFNQSIAIYPMVENEFSIIKKRVEDIIGFQITKLQTVAYILNIADKLSIDGHWSYRKIVKNLHTLNYLDGNKPPIYHARKTSLSKLLGRELPKTSLDELVNATIYHLARSTEEKIPTPKKGH